MKVVESLTLRGFNEDDRQLVERLGVALKEFENSTGDRAVLVFAASGEEIAQELDRQGVEPTRVIAVCSDPQGLPNGCLWLSSETLRTDCASSVLKAWIARLVEDPVQGLLAQISHDMRAPLSVISTAASLIAKFGADQAKTSRYLALINESSGILKGLVSDILDYSNIRQGEFSFTAADFHLPQLLVSITESFRLLIKHPEQLRVECQVDPSLPDFVNGDPGRLRQVITNLMNNALKFTESGSVILRASRKDDLISFAVEDTGIGIRREALEKIFLPYQQADKQIHSIFGGTGLGLTICRALVRRMDGDIGVESEVGKGSLFWFTARLPEVVSRQLSPLPDLHGRKVLVASASTTLVPAWLSQRPGVSGATTREEAEMLLPDGDFDLVIVDLELGQWDFVRQFVEHEGRHAVVLATAVGQRGDVALCKEIGVAGYLTAPLEREEMETALALVLAASRQDIVTKYSAKEYLAARSG